MKIKRPITLLILAVALLLMGVAFIAKRGVTTQTTSQALTLSDWAHGSAGTLKVMVNYPTELLTNQQNTITLTFEPDATLEQNMALGYIFDADFSANNSVITPQKRVLIPLEKGRQNVSWNIVPILQSEVEAVIQLALGGSDLNGAYAISPQASFELPFEVRQSNGLSPNVSFIVGLVMVVIAILCVLLFFMINKKINGLRSY
ncbi:MAG: hypothetical protein AAGU15_05925 [Anaerolineaceae bacterium]|jgi:hypothetical protein